MFALGGGEAWLVEETSLWRDASEPSLEEVILGEALNTFRAWKPIFLRPRLRIGVGLDTLHSRRTPELASSLNNSKEAPHHYLISTILFSQIREKEIQTKRDP